MPLHSNAITPYIHTRYVTDEKVIKALDEAYFNRDLLKAKASKCREYIVENYNLETTCKDFEKSLKDVITKWKKYPDFTVRMFPEKVGK